MSRYRTRPDFDLGPYEDEYRGFDERDGEQARGPLILVLALGVLLIFAGVIWNTYRQGVRPAEGGLPVIASSTDAYKRAPDEQGGLDIAGTGRGFYELMEGEVKDTLADISDRAEPPVLDGAPPAPPTVVSSSISTSPSLRPTLSEDAEPATAPEREIRVATLTPGASSRPEVSPAEIGKTDALVPDTSGPEQVSRFAPNGDFQVQLLAVRSEEAAARAWAEIRQRNPVLFRDAELEIQKADLGARGIFYRVRVSAFSDRETAGSFCSDVKAAGRDCIVVSRQNG